MIGGWIWLKNIQLIMSDERKQWFTDRINQVVWPVRTECKCRECVNGYINGIKIMNTFNAEGLHHLEDTVENEEFPVKYFDTWQDRNKWEEGYYKISRVKLVKEINTLNEKLTQGLLVEPRHEDDEGEFIPAVNLN